MLMSLRNVCVALGLGVTAIACKNRVPDDHTSLGCSPGIDPGKPVKALSMVWLHHSTGDSLLSGGLLAALRNNNIDFFDINYKEAVVDGYVIGDHTDTPDWPKTFNTSQYFDMIKQWELPDRRKHHDIVMFKSCFPNSDIKSDSMLDENKRSYEALVATFLANPDILFIGMSTPPLVKADASPDTARRAREWARWLTSDYANGLKNVKVFDLFDALAIAPDRPDANTLVPQFAVAENDSHPSREGAAAVTRLFIPWFNRAIRDAGFAN